MHTPRLPSRRTVVATVAAALLAATVLVVPTGASSAQGEEYVFATFDTPDGNTVTGDLNGVGFTMVSQSSFGEDPITVNPCDLSSADYSPAGPADGQCANTWARAGYEVFFEEPVEGLRIYFQGLRGEQNGAGGSFEYQILANGLECLEENDGICWEIQSGMTGAEPLDPFDGFLETTNAGLMNGVLFMGPSVPTVSEVFLEPDAGELDISLMGVTFAVPTGDPEPTTTTTPGPTPGPTSTTAPTPGPTTTVPAGKPVTPRYTG